MTTDLSSLQLHLHAGDGIAWNEIVSKYPGAHILQTWQWGEVKSRYGWQPERLIWRDAHGNISAAAQVLIRTVRLGGIGPALHVGYCPRGPLLDWSRKESCSKILADLEEYARSKRVIFIKVDPELILSVGEQDDHSGLDNNLALDQFTKRGWLFSSEQIQFRNTVWLDLTGSEETWLVRMKQKTRYNIRLAERKGVQVRVGSLDDLPLLYRMYAETSLRDSFVIRPENYYREVWGSFFQAGMADFLIAEVDGQAIAGLILFHFAGKAWYLYGMSRDAHREKMPNYLLQWEAMRLAKAKDCRIYDLWGAPEVFSTEDSMWGVYRFKEGLGGEVVRTAGAWDYPVMKWFYPAYTRLLPKILNIMRRRGVEQTRREVSL